MPRRLAGLVPLFLLTLTPAALAQKEFGFDNRKGSGQPYLTPAETVARMKVAPEFEVKLFAGEPQVINPVAFTIDERGRIWVVECFEYPSKTPKGKAPRDRIIILEDTDGDGVCDKRTVFAEGKDFPVSADRKKAGLGAFDLATGLEVGHGKVWLGAPPYLWTIEITGDNKDKPGKFETPLSGFGAQDTHETLNTFQWGPDGYLYGMHGIFTYSTVKSLDGPETRMNAAVWRLHPVTKKFEVYAEGTSNPWGMDWRNTDGEFILACCVIPHLYHIVPGGMYKRQSGPSSNPYAYGAIQEISDHTFHKESGWAHAGLISLDAPHIPEKYRNSVIFGSIHGCSLKQNILKPHGSSYTASRGDDFLVSGDKNFRPINLKWGPNGDIYLIDWHDQNPCHQAAADAWDYERGRVYRIQLKGRAGKKAPDLGALGLTDLAGGAFAADPWTARTALRLVQERGGGKLLPAINLPDKVPGAEFRLLATAGVRDVSAPLLEVGLADPEVVVRTTAVRLFPAGRELAPLADLAGREPSAGVRREIAAAALRLGEKHDVAPILKALMARKQDAADPLIPHLTWLAYEKVISKKTGATTPAEKELAWLAGAAPGNPFVRDQIVPKVMRRLVATGRPDDLALCVKFAADAKDVAVRRQALEGLAIALTNQSVTPPAAWAALQAELTAANDVQLTALANKLAVSFRDPAAVARALKLAADAGQPAEARTEAVRQVAALKAPKGAELLLKLMAGDAPIGVKVEAARGLAAFDSPAVPKQVLAAWADTPPAVRAELVTVLAGRKESAKQLLAAVGAKTVGRGEVTDNTVIRMQAFKDAGVDKLIETAWGRTRATPADLAATIDKMRADLGTGPASFARGKVVFEANCAKCHKFDGRGQEVGPPLDGAGRDIEYILANVIDPNRVIGAPYFLRTAATIDGRVEQGLLHAEDDQSITLKVENGVLKRIPKADLDGPVKVVEKSMMPEGLAAGMTTQNFRDLVRYLMANPYLATGTAGDKVVTAPVTGRIPVPAGATTLTFGVTAAAVVKTTLELGVGGAYTVSVDGKPVGKGGAGQAAVPVTLAPGVHVVTIDVDGPAGAVTARFLDPDRRLTYPE